MKKTYMTPALSAQYVEMQNIIALSLVKGVADDSPALVKDNDWDIFGSNDGIEVEE